MASYSQSYRQTFSQTFSQSRLDGVSGVSPAFSPADIPDLSIWYDFAFGSSALASTGPDVVATAGQAIVRVNDLSSAGIYGDQANASFQAAAVNRGYGYLAADCSAADYYDFVSAGAALLRNVTGITVFAVLDYQVNPTTQKWLGVWSTAASATSARFNCGAGRTSGKLFLGGRRLDANSYAELSSATSVPVGAVKPTIATFFVDYQNTTARIYINGSVDAQNTSYLTSGATSDTDSLAYRFGHISNLGPTTDVLEYIVFPRALTSDELSQMHAYLISKYSTAEPDQIRTVNGIWNQWISPTAIVSGGTTYFTGLDNAGTANMKVTAIDNAAKTASVQTIGTIERDDHNAAALIIDATNPWYIFYCNHGTDNFLRYRKSTTGLAWFGAEQTIATTEAATYAQAYRCSDGVDVDGRIICFLRQRPNWAYFYSDDEGATWSSQQAWIGSTTSNWLYHMTKKRSDGQTLATGIHLHPSQGNDQSIYYCELNLESGSVTIPDDNSEIGDLYDSGTLPIDYLNSSEVYEAVGSERTRLLDVSVNREVLFAKWGSVYGSDAKIYYAVFESGSWQVFEVCSAGDLLDPAADPRAYVGGGYFTETAGQFYVSTDSFTGTWEIRKYNRTGSSFSYEVVSESTLPRKRFRPIVPVGASENYPVIWCEGAYTNFTVYRTDQIAPYGGS